MRALRVFRDDASLSANPDLWGSIQQALDGSRYFILLASPSAANSPWVAKEAEHWIEHRGTEQVLVVLTEGELEWEADGRVDGTQTSALPRPLAEALDEEPRYVDLRWARSDTQLAQRDARFRGAIADLAAPIHGHSKDDMLGEDVRQHKRTLAVAWTAAAMLGALAIAASIAAVLAVQQRDRARTQSNVALSRQLAAESASQLNGPGSVSPLLAVESFRRVQGQSDARTYDARSAMLEAIQRSPRLRATLPPSASPIKGADLSPDGKTLVTVDREGKLHFFDAHDGQALGPSRAGSGARPRAMAFSPGSSTLAVGDNKGVVTLWNVKRQSPEQQASGAPRWISRIAFSRDGKRLAVTGADTTHGWSHVTVWRTAHPQSPTDLPGRAALVRAVAFTPDGRAVVTTDAQGHVQLWRGHGSHRLRGESGFRLATGRDGRVLLLAKAGRGAQIVDALTGKPLGPKLADNGSFLTDIAADGRVVASLGTDSMHLWNLRGRKAALEKVFVAGGNQLPVLSADGTELATLGDDGGVQVWDARPAAPFAAESLPALPGAAGGLTSSVALGPNGRAAASESNGLALWDGAGQRATRLSAPSVSQLSFSPNGQLVAGALTGGGIDVWSVGRHHPPFTLSGLHGSSLYSVVSVAFSPDSKKLTARIADGGVAVWDVSNAKPVLKSRTKTKATLPPPPCPHFTAGTRLDQPCRESVTNRALTPDGKTLVYSTFGDGLKFWSLAGSSLGGVSTDTTNFAVSPDGLTLATVSSTGGLQLWDIPRRQPLGAPFVDPAGVGAVAFANDGAGIVSSDSRGGVTVWDPIVLSTSFDAWRARLCRLAGRNLTRLQWSQFLPGVRYRKTCPGLP